MKLQGVELVNVNEIKHPMQRKEYKRGEEKRAGRVECVKMNVRDDLWQKDSCNDKKTEGRGLGDITEDGEILIGSDQNWQN